MKQWSYHWCTEWCHYLLSSNRFLSVNTSREMAHQVWLCYKQTSWLQWNQTWLEKSRSVWVIYLECVVENGMRRKSRHKQFTKCFMLGYKNGLYQTKDHSLCNNEHCDCKQTKIVKGKLFILMQYVILLRLCWLKLLFFMGLYTRIVFFCSKSFFKLTTQLD